MFSGRFVKRRLEFPDEEGLTQAAILAKTIEADIFNLGGREMYCISLEGVVLIHSNGHREEFSKIYLRPKGDGLGEPEFWEVMADFSRWLARQQGGSSSGPADEPAVGAET